MHAPVSPLPTEVYYEAVQLVPRDTRGLAVSVFV